MSATPVFTTSRAYRGRFAPSPTGPLHQGSLVAAMASYLDAKIHQGQWLVRIEDIDETRTVADADRAILQALQTLGMQWDEEVVWQSHRKEYYQRAFDQLAGYAYPCSCSRREIADSHSRVAADGAAIYPGTCRHGLMPGKIGRTLRLRVPDLEQEGEYITFQDAWLGSISQHLALEVGDFVLKRADGFWAYQLAVVVDDAQQDITHIVRGADLLDSTARQIYLQRLLHLPTPHYMHVPLVLDQHGEKLSKQTGAQELNLNKPLDTLQEAAGFLGLTIGKPESIHGFWQAATLGWHNHYGQCAKP